VQQTKRRVWFRRRGEGLKWGVRGGKCGDGGEKERHYVTGKVIGDKESGQESFPQGSHLGTNETKKKENAESKKGPKARKRRRKTYERKIYREKTTM